MLVAVNVGCLQSGSVTFPLPCLCSHMIEKPLLCVCSWGYIVPRIRYCDPEAAAQAEQRCVYIGDHTAFDSMEAAA